MKQISSNEFTLFLEAWIFLCLARVILIFVPFKKVVKLLGNNANLENETMTLPKNTSNQIKIQLSISRGCKYSFWRTMCFEQALAAKMMLKRRNIYSRIYFGVKKSNLESNKMQAHAWLDSEGVTLTGNQGKESFTIVGIFEC